MAHTDVSSDNCTGGEGIGETGASDCVTGAAVLPHPSKNIVIINTQNKTFINIAKPSMDIYNSSMTHIDEEANLLLEMTIP